MNITLIGSGNVATHLALALHASGHNIMQVWSREYDHAEQLASRVFAEPIDKLSLLYPTADIYILAVSDDALFDMALDLRLRDALVLHTSGTTKLDVLRPISRKCGVLWSPQTFVRNIQMDYAALPFCIEGSSPQVEQKIEDLARSVSPHVYHLTSEQRQYLHLAAVMTNNFGNALNAMAQDLLRPQGVPFEILQAIIRTTAYKAIEAGEKDAALSNNSEGSDNTEDSAWQNSLWRQQTGPAARKDEKTIMRHRQMLLNDNDALELYEMMTHLIQERLKVK